MRAVNSGSGRRPSFADGAGPDGHLDEGVGASLGWGAGQFVDVGVAAESGFGFGPVGFEQLTFDGTERRVEDEAVDRIEVAVQVEDPVEDLHRVEPALLVLFLKLASLASGSASRASSRAPDERVIPFRLRMSQEVGLIPAQRSDSFAGRALRQHCRHMGAVDLIAAIAPSARTGCPTPNGATDLGKLPVREHMCPFRR